MLHRLSCRRSSSHHRFGLWWLRYLCLCCLRDFFLPLAETLPCWWVYRCLSLRLSCRRGNSHPRFWVLVTALPLVASIYVAVILTFLPLVEIPLFVNLPLFFLLSAVQQSPSSWSAFSSFTLPSDYSSTFGWDFSLLVILPFVSRLLCKRDGSFLCSRSPQVAFLPLVETFPFLWVCRCLSPSSAV